MYNDIIDTIGFVSQTDPELGAAMGRELARQKQNIELIASENIVSPAVMAAMGKLMLGTARVADYLQDPALTKFVADECHRLMAYQDADGYLGSYADKENVWIPEDAKKAMGPVYGWNTVWNLWNRKYAIWAMLMAYKTTDTNSAGRKYKCTGTTYDSDSALGQQFAEGNRESNHDF